MVSYSVSSPFCGADSCSVQRGQTLTGDVWFTPTRAHASLQVFPRAFSGGSWIDLPIDPPHDNACNNLHRGDAQVSCPTVPNSEHRWNLNFLVSPDFPQLLGTTVECKLKYFLNLIINTFST